MNPKNGCVTFARSSKYLRYIKGVDRDIWVIAPSYIPTFKKSDYGENVKFRFCEYPEYEFTKYHNSLYENFFPDSAFTQVGDNCDIHPTVILDIDGVKVVNGPDGKKIHFVHTGSTIIRDNVRIGPYTVIHRGTMESNSTIIESGCEFGALNNIGHNCRVGENTIIAAGVVLNGGVEVGRNCWVGSKAVIKHYVTICDKVIIGMGAVVTKDIDRPGIYVGNPARFLKPVKYMERWNF